jgi:hypothetical protein
LGVSILGDKYSELRVADEDDEVDELADVHVTSLVDPGAAEITFVPFSSSRYLRKKFFRGPGAGGRWALLGGCWSWVVGVGIVDGVCCRCNDACEDVWRDVGAELQYVTSPSLPLRNFRGRWAGFSWITLGRLGWPCFDWITTDISCCEFDCCKVELDGRDGRERGPFEPPKPSFIEITGNEARRRNVG